MRTHVADHPLVAHKLTALRDERTDSPTFRRLADELVTLLAYEATRDVRTEPVEITTPVAPTVGIKLASPKPLVVPILRAGLGMLDGMTTMCTAGQFHLRAVANTDMGMRTCVRVLRRAPRPLRLLVPGRRVAAGRAGGAAAELGYQALALTDHNGVSGRWSTRRRPGARACGPSTARR